MDTMYKLIITNNRTNNELEFLDSIFGKAKYLVIADGYKKLMLIIMSGMITKEKYAAKIENFIFHGTLTSFCGSSGTI